MKTFRTLFVGALATALLAGCASRRSWNPDDCLCRKVWVPPHCDARVAYCVEGAKTHERDLPVMGLCRTTQTDCVERVQTAPVDVADRCTRRVPTIEYDCVPTYGYRRVEDTADALVPVCGPHCVPVYQDVTRPQYEDRCDRCGRTVRVLAGYRTDTEYVGDRVECKQVGERLVTYPDGDHLERVQNGRRNAPVIVGEHEATITTGTHVEQVPVWRSMEPVARDTGVHAQQVGSRRDVVETMPWRYEGYQQPVTIPGFCATVCDHPGHHHDGIVITSAEYEEFLKAAQR